MIRNCVICGVEFDSRHARSVCCGDDCRAKRTVENWKAASARAVAAAYRCAAAIQDLTARIERIETTLHNMCDAPGMPR